MGKIMLKMLGLCCLLTACLREEIPVAPFDRGETIRQQIAMGTDYAQQIWFDLSSNSIVKTSHKTAWDLAFDCSDSSHFIRLNTAKLMRAAKLQTANFDTLVSTTGLDFRSDHPSGGPDSLALGQWWLYNNIYIIDLGYDELGNALGYRKMKAELLANTDCRLTFAQLDGTAPQVLTASKDSVFNHIAFSLIQEQVLQIEPPKADYDLVFSTYTHFFYAPYTPYLVTGVLLNPWNTQAVLDSTAMFASIDADFLPNYNLKTAADVIGYNWKFFDFQQNTYQVNADMNFVIRDAQGFYYKLHFIDFYNEEGLKGFPSFEFELI